MKRTKWFPAGIKPVREGLYETRVDGSQTAVWSCWKGYWTAASEDKHWVMQKAAIGDRSFWQQRNWRGLQGDEHSLEIGASTYLVEFSEGPDRPGDDE